MNKARTIYSGEVEGTFYYIYLTNKDPKSDKYSITVGHIKEEDAKFLKSKGVSVRLSDNYGWMMKAKSTFEIRVVDADGKDLSNAQISKMGNGSKGIIKIAVKDTGKSNPSQNLNGVQVLHYEEYDGGVSFSRKEGYRGGEGKDTVESEVPSASPSEIERSSKWEEDVDE